ncbi:hypothetical protein DPMN_164389 [Dreissena polymorpha]|uniref:Protein sleepless n=1 Tax=Dreissena polymorpha TaxID=45954 RepID=A0A9D4EVV1_DREPO|nr:hypothetical protein DPMN_164389 [Dreissena polymorpha]
MHDWSCAHHCLLDSPAQNHAYAMKTNIFLKLTVVICVHAEYCAAIKCYTCIISGCEDHFDKSGRTLSDGCAQCLKTKSETSGVHAVTRSCLSDNIGSDGCSKTTILGMEMSQCLCSTDGCNGSSSVYTTMVTVIVPLLMLAKHVV